MEQGRGCAQEVQQRWCGEYNVDYIPLHENATGNQNQLDIITNCSSVSTMFYYGDKKLSDCV